LNALARRARSRDPVLVVHVDPAFRPLLAAFDLEAFDRDESSIYGMWPDTRLAYVNAAYQRFAVSEGGPRACVDGTLGVRVIDTVLPVLRPFYEQLYARARASAEPITHRYDCHSPELERKYDLRLFSLGGGQGLLAVHALVLSRPHAVTADAMLARYAAKPSGLVIQCAHCRRVERANERGRWDLVPEYVARSPERTSHGLCRLCAEYHWGTREGDPP
jgi:hypothetical protein